MRWAFLSICFLGALAARANPIDERPVGVVPLRSEGISRPVSALVNEQLRMTLESLSVRRVIGHSVGSGAADDPEALRAAGAFGDFHALVGGFVSGVDEPGIVTLLWVPSDGGKVRTTTSAVPGNAESAFRAAIDAAICALVGVEGDTSSCQVPLRLTGNARGAEMELDGVRVTEVNAPIDISIDVGSHIARGCLGSDCSTRRRLDLVRNSSLNLRIERSCNRLHLLGLKEEPDCGGAQTADVVPLVLVEEGPNWKGIAALSAGGAAAIAGVVFGFQARSAANAYRDGFESGSISADAAATHLQNHKSNNLRANVSYVIAGIAAAAGATMLVWDF